MVAVLEKYGLRTRFFRLTGRGTLPMFRAISRAAFSRPRERVAQPVEQLTFNQ